MIILGRTSPPDREHASIKARIDVEVDLGDRFSLKVRGLDVRMAGPLGVSADNGRPPRATGILRVAEGSYRAYGQRLKIEKGIFNFAGPLDNPGLDIVALRKNLPMEAGVAVSGTALSPRVALVSTPAVADSEKLAWLVLGHGLENATKGDIIVVQAAASALLARGESLTLQTRFAQAIGLDEFTVGGAGGLERRIVTLGKRLSSRAYLAYEQSLSGAANTVKPHYDLSRRWSLRTQAGGENAVDLFYTLSFD